MSKSSERGLAFEQVVRKLTSSKLNLEIKRDKQSGAGIHKQDIRDRFGELPIFIECKDHQTIKPKEWWRDANGKSSYGQAPVVVFPDNEEVLCVMRYSDLLNLIKEGIDWRKTADTARNMEVDTVGVVRHRISDEDLAAAAKNKVTAGAKTCRNGHLTIDAFGYCQGKGCRYSRGYKAPKEKKGLR